MPHIPDSRHADHDPLAIAAFAAGDATGAELETARDLVASCTDCATLHADLRAISAALPELPAPARTRDFRLTAEQAASIRPAGWRRLLAPLAGPRFAFAGPLGGGLATLGIAGLLVAGSLGAPLAATAPAGGDTAAAQAPIEGTGPAEAPAPSGDLTYKGLEASPEPSGPVQAMTGPAGSAAPSDDPNLVLAAPADSPVPESQRGEAARDVDTASAGPSLVLPLVSVALLAVGIGLAALRLVGRRLAARG